VKKEPGRMRLNSDPEKVVEHTQILHSKLLLKSGNDAAKKWLTGGCEDNVINIEEQVCNVSSMVIDKQRCIRLGLHKPQCQQKSSKSMVPRPGCLFEAVKRPVELTDHVRTGRINEPHRLTAVHCLSEKTVQKSILDVQLMDGP
jgi:hypothetical protein